ncbi:MAG TPA: DUF5723 family protein [Bacteroidota bacterium]|nr:DUF5723 family protein [Bacteroidota bacterium]
MNKRRVLYILILCLIVGSLAVAGDRSNVRGMAMGRTFNASSRGLDALGVNPANLALADRSSISLNILSLGTRLSTELFSYDVYQEFFTGDPNDRNKPKILTEDDKNRLLSLLPEGRGATRSDFEIFSLGFSFRHPKFGGIAFAMTDRLGARFDLPKEYLRMFLFGFDSTGSTYNFEGTAVSAWWWREYNISYGIELPLNRPPVKNIAVGIGVKLLRGYAAVKTDHYAGIIGVQRVGSNQYRGIANFDFLTSRSGIDELGSNRGKSFSVFPDPAGTGIGFDLGLSVELLSGARIAASITDIGSLRWNKNIVETAASYSLAFTDPFSSQTRDSLEKAFKGSNSPGESFSTRLPTAFRLGASMEVQKIPGLSALPGTLLFAVDATQGFTESMGGIVQPRISLGMEYRLIPLLPLRTGFSFFGGDVVRWGAGFGLDFYAFNLDLATENLAMLFSSKKVSMFSFSLGMRIRV